MIGQAVEQTRALHEGTSQHPHAVAGRKGLLGPHIGIGFCVATVVFVLAVIAMTKKVIVPGILGVVFALLLPVVGFMQLPLTFHTMGAIQAAHIFLALAIIGVAERLYAAIQRAG